MNHNIEQKLTSAHNENERLRKENQHLKEEVRALLKIQHELLTNYFAPAPNSHNKNGEQKP